MQIPPLILAVAAEVYLLLIGATLLLFWHARKQKTLLRRQQQKLLDVISDRQPFDIKPHPISYKQFINQELELTRTHFNHLAPGSDISGIQPSDVPTNQRIVALRYAFLRAEELGTTETAGSDRYWALFEQALEPLLSPPDATDPQTLAELETCKKRIENLEKFKTLFFELEEQWNSAKVNASNYYNELFALGNKLGIALDDRERFESLLNSYHNSYQGMDHHFSRTGQSLEDTRTITVIRQDPRAAEEIFKLRNVAADQYRLINNLQRKLEEANSDHEKVVIVHELEQQLQRQIRFVQESDTCIRLLEDELTHANEKITKLEHQLQADHQISEENQQIKETLQRFTLESKHLLHDIDELEAENRSLRSNIETINKHSDEHPTDNNNALDQLQANFLSLQKQYADLEEKYLALKLK
ncbi:hypothetical protein [Cellvibrio japonicus]|uniref:Uncharacterized protein n=1 Tax=Cellvibrio japonicus (strain Ueda107) TaxID=498211 RepID=B3PE50_CELJU|nr:hypothetical protein [Cellvibrio japonicus]ACE84511.1 conserved hypothetical protein [Cellvibrio japonicus Ueda107]QEI12095.1 hypothetical protein FY117_07570 [Cellvibrio japonicus]QEI15669.1 hypothetical protein FY116_07575 [Cellvibrio japonicus]QEI19247.1 hypothetical protein FY115_07570 [Cellvibrio japonicus]